MATDSHFLERSMTRSTKKPEIAVKAVQLSRGKIFFENCAVTYVSEDHVCVVGYQESFSAKWVWCFYNLSPTEAGEIVSAAMNTWNLFTR